MLNERYNNQKKTDRHESGRDQSQRSGDNQSQHSGDNQSQRSGDNQNQRSGDDPNQRGDNDGWNSGDFAKTMMDNVTAFYKKSLEMNPFLEHAMNAAKQRSALFENITFDKAPEVFAQLNAIFTRLSQEIMQKQQMFLSELFRKIGEGWAETKRKTPNDVMSNTQYPQLARLTAGFFAEITEMLLKANEEVTDALSNYCDSCDECGERGACDTGSEYGAADATTSRPAGDRDAKSTSKAEDLGIDELGDISELFPASYSVDDK
jgi:hypothetical protein